MSNNHIQDIGSYGDSFAIFNSAINKTIASVELDAEHDKLKFAFSDGTRINLFDDGQYCCEMRYMRTDDDLAYFVVAKLLGAEVKDAARIKMGEYGDEHEIQFLVVTTDRGSFSMANHNEHNGYYGGFSIVAEAVTD